MLPQGLIFFNTFVFANTIFFSSQFGRHSCFFSRTGFQGTVPLSWWVSAPPSSLQLCLAGTSLGPGPPAHAQAAVEPWQLLQ